MLLLLLTQKYIKIHYRSHQKKNCNMTMNYLTAIQTVVPTFDVIDSNRDLRQL